MPRIPRFIESSIGMARKACGGTSPDSFDGQLVSIVDRSLHTEHDMQTNLHTPDGQVLPVASAPYTLWAKEQWLRETEYQGPWNDAMNGGLRQITTAHGTEAARVVMYGRLQMLLLLDSAGGRGLLGGAIIDTIKNIRRRGGQSVAYAKSQAKSAAADIFLAADTRKTMRNASFLWHVGEVDPARGPDFTKQEKVRQWTDIKRKLLVAAERKSILQDMLRQAEGETEDFRLTVELSAEQLVDLGIASFVERDEAGMEDFARTSGIRNDSAVHKFFVSE